MKALYRRYRPKSLSEVVGQEQITSVLANSLKNGKIGHAYLFIGPRGTGKTSVARILAHEINHFDYELEDDYLDIIEIDAASNRGIDDIRELRQRANIAPTKGKYKIYIIDEVHMLTKEAFNALLKTLEEPPEHVVFIMATTDAQKVPVTITSRSQIYTFKLADPSTMLEHVKKICQSEKIDIEEEALKIVVKRGGGSYRDTLSILDQVSTLSDKKITAELLNHALGLPQETAISELLDSYNNGNLDNIRQLLINLAETGVKSEVIASELIDAIMAQPNPKYIQLLDKLTQINPTDAPNIKSGKLLVALCANAMPSFPVQAAPTPIIQKATTIATPPVVKPTAAQKPAPAETKETSAPAPVPTPTPEPAAPTIQKVANDADANTIWQAVIKNIAEKSPLLAGDIIASKYTYKDKVLTIYTGSYIKAKNIDKRRNFITEVIPNDVSVEITKETLADDPDVANIAAIMGGGEEIQIDV